MVNLVTQVLEPTIGNYFRNAAQNSDVIDFLKNRQTQASGGAEIHLRRRCRSTTSARSTR